MSAQELQQVVATAMTEASNISLTCFIEVCFFIMM